MISRTSNRRIGTRRTTQTQRSSYYATLLAPQGMYAAPSLDHARDVHGPAAITEFDRATRFEATA